MDPVVPRQRIRDRRPDRAAARAERDQLLPVGRGFGLGSTLGGRGVLAANPGAKRAGRDDLAATPGVNRPVISSANARTTGCPATARHRRLRVRPPLVAELL